jgi:hypothetical protein
MDGGTFTGYSTINTGTPISSWNVAVGSGNFIFNGGTLNMGGTNNGDAGHFNVTSTGGGFLWYGGTINIGVYSGGGAGNGGTSDLAVTGNINIEATGSGQTMAWTGGTPNGPHYTYCVMDVSGTGNTITVGVNPTLPTGWTGTLRNNNTIYDIAH